MNKQDIENNHERCRTMEQVLSFDYILETYLLSILFYSFIYSITIMGFE